MNTLTLTKEEEKAFAELPEAVREGWDVQAETIRYEDTPAKQLMRLSLLRLHDPALLALREKAGRAGSGDELVALIQGMDVSAVDDSDLAELFFALGPTVLSELIAVQIASAKTDADVEGVQALTVIRHSILSSFHPVA